MCPNLAVLLMPPFPPLLHAEGETKHWGTAVLGAPPTKQPTFSLKTVPLGIPNGWAA